MINMRALLKSSHCDNHSPEYNDQLHAYSALERHHLSSLSSQHTRVCSTLCMDWAKGRGSLRDFLLALVDGAGWSAACRRLSMRVDLRTIAHLWRAWCPMLKARLRARRELLLISEALQGGTGSVNLFGVPQGRRTGLSPLETAKGCCQMVDSDCYEECYKF
jgi:hypothetical protein